MTAGKGPLVICGAVPVDVHPDVLMAMVPAPKVTVADGQAELLSVMVCATTELIPPIARKNNRRKREITVGLIGILVLEGSFNEYCFIFKCCIDENPY